MNRPCPFIIELGTTLVASNDDEYVSTILSVGMGVVELIFDFEGSKIEEITRFFRRFGAENQEYFNCRMYQMKPWQYRTFQALRRIKGWMS